MRKKIIKQDGSTEQIMQESKTFFYLNKKKLNKKNIEIDFDEIAEISPILSESLLENPSKTLNIMRMALDSIILKDKKILLKNLVFNKKQINEIRIEDIKKLISVKGIIKRKTKIIPRVISIKYECPNCGVIISVLQNRKKKTSPKNCSCGRKGGFRMISEKRKNIQELNIEEVPEELDGKQPQQLRIYLEDELTEKSFSGKLQPGRRIEIIGIIDTMPPFMSQKDTESNLTDFILFANNAFPLEDEEIIITEEDEKQILEISRNNPLKQLSESLAPEIFGNSEIKRAIILQLVKGVPKEKSDGSLSREDIHILLVGDPGVSKSVILKSTHSRTPKSRMVVGTKTSRVGLGAMAVKDELTNTWSLEVGSLVLSSGSLLCLDEIDKMYKEHLSELLEPMSLGSVSINKAGISAKLPARTSILASANPIQGTFNLNGEPLSRQIDLPSPIMNRFDLIFIMIDRPNEKFDSESVKYIFESHKEKRKPEIPMDLFKKYIFYCKKLKPKLTDELQKDLEEFYIKIRKMSSRDDIKALPVNLRNMEGLIRLSEAHSKLRLSEYVELKDLNVAKQIFLFCLNQIGLDDETGLIDMSRLTEKVPIGKRGKVKKLMDLIESLSNKDDNLIPYSKIIEEAQKLDIRVWESKNFIEQLRKEAQIFEPKQGFISVLK